MAERKIKLSERETKDKRIRDLEKNRDPQVTGSGLSVDGGKFLEGKNG